MAKRRDYRGLTALVIGAGIQLNLLALILTEGSGASHAESTLMATILGAALATIGVYVAGARNPRLPPAPGVVPAPAEAAASAAVSGPPAGTAHRSTPRRIPTGETPTVTGTHHDDRWPTPPQRDPWTTDPGGPTWPPDHRRNH